ncbi:hypothetical protein BHE74_00057893 [Ensete ventricosum]|nr:hypothetical protein BHE74_00057893 [Ensete ventricosum]
MPGVREARRALVGGEMPTLPVPGRLYDTWRSSYNRSTDHVELATSAAQVSEGVTRLTSVISEGEHNTNMAVLPLLPNEVLSNTNLFLLPYMLLKICQR